MAYALEKSILAAVTAFGIWALLPGKADAHTHGEVVYPGSCCNSAATSPTGDCAPIDDRFVSERSDGYHVSIPLGGHPKLKTKGYSAVIPYPDAKKQPLSNDYHICLSTDGAYRFCFFPKPGAV